MQHGLMGLMLKVAACMASEVAAAVKVAGGKRDSGFPLRRDTWSIPLVESGVDLLLQRPHCGVLVLWLSL